ncbi:GGDEF domain-containing protein [Desulfoluna spongiiphila]|uniref:diguanylate cyclase n=1 Tax=Desulfoluna spongiiphila TaxID=419481 RepID=A0A1G5AZV2_9BACT|nr:diguanylate cyclase [Desulfoluna spongiiphila]SCX83423.1 diguanylate cyclase (GGDEF) domain-containing protein [Desulfoluna spongiiphila]
METLHSLLSHEEAIRRCLTRRVGFSAFPAPLGTDFLHQRNDKRNRHYLPACLIAIVIYNLFFISDRIMVPDIAATAWRVRFYVVTPAMALVMGLVTIRRFQRHTELFTMVLMLLTSFSIIYLLTRSHHPNVAHYYTGIILIAIFGNIVAGIRFKTGLVTSATILFAYVISLDNMPAMGREAGINSALVLLASLVISLFGCYQLESEARREFLHGMLQRINARKLAETNRKLAVISITDGLTGLFNRRHFDAIYDAQWRSAARVGAPISLLFIDIDHFKLFNDHYGHQAGDQCLERVAGVIDSCVNRAHDLAARYGGEEFVVLLPHTPLDKALIVADRIARGTKKLAIAHDASPTHALLTLSIGASCMTPRDNRRPEQLLKCADTALYRAKDSGRNRIVPLADEKAGAIVLHGSL